LVPVAQSTFSGLVAGTAAAAVAWAAFAADFLTAWAVAVAVCVCAAWFWRLAVTTGTLYRVESFTGLDLNRDGVKGKPQPGHLVGLNPYKGRKAQAMDVQDRLRADFTQFVMGCATDTSARRWEAKIGRARFQEWRDLLVKSGYAAWNTTSKKDGWKLTTHPGAIIDALVEPASTPAK